MHIIFQDGFCFGLVQYSSLPTLTMDVLHAKLPVIEVNDVSLREGDTVHIYMWLGLSDTETYHNVLQK